MSQPTPGGAGTPGEARYVDGAGGLRLHYRAWPAGSPRGALLVLHGLFEHSRRYTELAATMTAAGLSTFALDLRGHGGSDGRRGHVARFELFLEDVDRFRDDVAAGLLAGLPVFLLAHSMGGLIGVRYLQERDSPFAGAVITSPWLGTAVAVPGWQRGLAAVLDRVFPAFPFPSDLDADLLSHDPERVADYRDDPAIHSTVTPRLWRQVAAAADRALERVDAMDGPMLFLLAGDDQVVDTGRSLDLARSVAAGHVTIDVLDGYYHEVLQETGRAAVMARILDWLEARLP